ncbi:serine/threonine protein kinase with Chase2 sensor [Richelia sinica FACHB-800]|uniref:non-specific serine/threonine protein kinase n=1 Tax=Richelia sinica FACHB-800 TaxID=1357546 RepID=A0A975T711_9NOST|nr:CHASE2 domain-containing serine/threonine-protein kinase [Richelia sinica]MBD2666630.1 CHASE2 domain-containing protein [Richelia sinica FACHB-800]QXE23406.1 serine/threonine protein kinase with Chase2 sensor [Richelia sinica FACHB-800]
MINLLLAKFRSSTVKKPNYPQTLTTVNWLSTILLTSMGVTALVWGMRELKWLQSWELSAYDMMLRSRPLEPADSRILLVTITQADLAQEPWPLSDATVNKLLSKLSAYRPRVIGLNIYRDKQASLGNNLPTIDNLVTTCLFSNIGRAEIAPPPNFPLDNVGFNDVVTDSENEAILRRGLMFANPTTTDKKCHTQISFATLLAILYLEKQGIHPTFTQQQEILIGNKVFPRLHSHSGSYQSTDDHGYQILINYRHSEHLAQQVTLTQVLRDEVKPQWVEDKLVIIGTTATSIHPGFYTPFNSLANQPARTHGMFIHAQIASQIISTVLDGRPLISYWTDWTELLWIWVWSLVGAVLAWQWRHPLLLLTVTGFILIGLVGIAAGLYLQSLWIPLIPSGLTLLISGVFVIVYAGYESQRQHQLILQQVNAQKDAISELNVLFNQTTIFQSLGSHSQELTDTVCLRTGGLIFSGRYKIHQTLGAGGFGKTYLAEDTHLPGHPICVVKQLMPARRDPQFLEVARRLFNTEADILAILGKHPQIPELFAYSEENQNFYLVQQYIEGHTLSTELPPEQGVKSELFVINMLMEILEILAFIHKHDVIHRDIKPSNIIRSKNDSRLVLIDFGAVKLIQNKNDEETELATVAIGTKGYTPPEQFAGHPQLSSDIYALGIIAIQALTGVLPQDFHQHSRTGNIIWTEQADINPQLAVIVNKMVCYHFSDRYQSAVDVLQDLQQLVVDS